MVTLAVFHSRRWQCWKSLQRRRGKLRFQRRPAPGNSPEEMLDAHQRFQDMEEFLCRVFNSTRFALRGRDYVRWWESSRKLRRHLARLS